MTVQIDISDLLLLLSSSSSASDVQSVKDAAEARVELEGGSPDDATEADQWVDLTASQFANDPGVAGGLWQAVQGKPNQHDINSIKAQAVAAAQKAGGGLGDDIYDGSGNLIVVGAGQTVSQVQKTADTTPVPVNAAETFKKEVLTVMWVIGGVVIAYYVLDLTLKVIAVKKGVSK